MYVLVRVMHVGDTETFRFHFGPGKPVEDALKKTLLRNAKTRQIASLSFLCKYFA